MVLKFTILKLLLKQSVRFTTVCLWKVSERTGQTVLAITARKEGHKDMTSLEVESNKLAEMSRANAANEALKGRSVTLEEEYQPMKLRLGDAQIHELGERSLKESREGGVAIANSVTSGLANLLKGAGSGLSGAAALAKVLA